MTDEATRSRNDEAEPEAEADEPVLDETSAAEPASDETELQCAVRERAEFLANWQRAKADYQNLRRRQVTDIEAAVRRELTPVLDGILGVLDNLELALRTECTSTDAKNLMVGVKMTRDQMTAMLAQNQVTPIATEGEFDPNLHQAVATIPTADHEPGQVLEVVRNGWMFRDQVLRPANVKVSTAPDAPDAHGAEEA
ncbi:MAG: nucleotide exchange factor GrpE [bacterium]|nr:nucleotide exchange factor GrpE [bacterium]